MTLTTLRLSKAGAKVACHSVGRGAPVVLIHGVGLQSAAWGPQIEALSAQNHVIALDMPGHGGSDPLPDGSRLDAFVSWAAEALEALALGPVSLAGHSMGALIAGGVAVDHPALVRRVALLSPVFRRGPSDRAAVEARAALIREGEINHAAPLSRWFSSAPEERAVRAATQGWLEDVSPTGYATAYSAFATGDATYANRMNEISAPLLALTGSEDANSTPAMAQAIANTVQNGRTKIIEGHRHMVNLTAPDLVNHALADWLLQSGTNTLINEVAS